MDVSSSLVTSPLPWPKAHLHRSITWGPVIPILFSGPRNGLLDMWRCFLDNSRALLCPRQRDPSTVLLGGGFYGLYLPCDSHPNLIRFICICLRVLPEYFSNYITSFFWKKKFLLELLILGKTNNISTFRTFVLNVHCIGVYNGNNLYMHQWETD